MKQGCSFLHIGPNKNNVIHMYLTFFENLICDERRTLIFFILRRLKISLHLFDPQYRNSSKRKVVG